MTTYCDPNGRQWHVVPDDYWGKWWVVLDANRQVVSGGFKRHSDAMAEAKRLAAADA